MPALQDNPEYKIAFFDIETSPNIGYTWGKYEQNVIEFQREWHLLSFAVKWSGLNKVEVYGLPDFPGYDKDKSNDRLLTQKLWDMMNEADLIVAHNGDKFDCRKANTRFLAHGLTPPAPYKTVDTLKLARKYFALNSNKLNDIAEFLGIGQKIETRFELWLKCMDGDPKAWAKMKKYNSMDVVLLEKVYDKFRPWHVTHPNITIKQIDMEPTCPACGSKDVQKRGFNYMIAYKSQRYQCKACGHWAKGGNQKLEGVHLK